MIKELTLGLFNQQSERDKQKLVGASNLSDPCTYHLAHALAGTPEQPMKYWLGGKIGTAVHSFIEDAIAKSAEQVFSDAAIEQKITLGAIDGYGTVSSKPDLVLPSVKHVIDWKTSTRAKSRKLQNVIDELPNEPKDKDSYYTVMKYVAQIQLYAWGLNNSGTPIEKLSLVFINRDGTTDADIWDYTIDYDANYAQAVWNRAVKVWEAIQGGHALDDFAKHDHCFKCKIGI